MGRVITVYQIESDNCPEPKDEISVWEMFRIHPKYFPVCPSCLHKVPMYVNRKKFWKMNALYFLMKGKTVVYIGQTSNLFQRIKDHLKTKDFDSVKYTHFPNIRKYYNITKRMRLERKYIQKYRAKYNVSGR